MKKLIALFLVLICLPGLIGCSQQKEYNIRIVIPAGNQGEFVYSEEVILPRKSKLDIKSIDMNENAEFVLRSVGDTQENVYECQNFHCTNFPKGVPMLIDVEKGTWYKIGVAMKNPANEDIVVVFQVVNAKVRLK